MVKLQCLGLIFLMAGPITDTSKGLRVQQYPYSHNLMQGETATLSCHFKVDATNYGVQWFKTRSEKHPISNSTRRFYTEKNHTSSLVITQVTLEDSGWYYCEVNVLQKDPEWGNGTELIVLAPPSAPVIFLQIPFDGLTGVSALYCLTGGFHPSQLTLTWTYRSVARIDYPSFANCTLPSIDLHGDPAKLPVPQDLSADWLANPVSNSVPQQCFHMMDNSSQKVYLVSAFTLPLKQSLGSGITFSCTVQHHPALNSTLTASFHWEAAPNELIIYLNVFKMCFLAGLTMLLLWEAIKQLFAPRT